MGDLSLHFNRQEFACKCTRCDQDQIDYKLIEVLERLRRFTGTPITITSGNRCYQHNLDSGGAPMSKHLFSIAADFQVKGWDPNKIYDLLDEWYPDTFGLKAYRSWVHLDVRRFKWRGGKP